MKEHRDGPRWQAAKPTESTVAGALPSAEFNQQAGLARQGHGCTVARTCQCVKQLSFRATAIQLPVIQLGQTEVLLRGTRYKVAGLPSFLLHLKNAEITSPSL